MLDLVAAGMVGGEGVVVVMVDLQCWEDRWRWGTCGGIEGGGVRRRE
jgi:hypothetical protein